MSKEILITGATGFIGANLIRHVLLAGDNAHIVLRKGANAWRIKDMLPRAITHAIDMRNIKDVTRVVRQINPHRVFHLASYGAYPFQADVAEMVRTDVGGTYALLQAARTVDRLEAFISAGSSTEYGVKDHPIRETNTL